MDLAITKVFITGTDLFKDIERDLRGFKKLKKKTLLAALKLLYQIDKKNPKNPENAKTHAVLSLSAMALVFFFFFFFFFFFLTLWSLHRARNHREARYPCKYLITDDLRKPTRVKQSTFKRLKSQKRTLTTILQNSVSIK